MERGAGARRAWRESRTFFFDEEIKRLFPSFSPPAERFFAGESCSIQGDDPLSQATSFDLNFYLPDDLLKKVDMASMAHGLETRAPFLDHHFVEYAMGIRPDLKLKGNQTKYLFRKALEGYLPNEILYREKQGFGVPIESWVRGELQGRIKEQVLGNSKMSDYFEKAEIEKVYNAAQDPQNTDWRAGLKLWILFIFEVWLNQKATP